MRLIRSSILFLTLFSHLAAAPQKQLKIFISVDMEGIGGIGTGELTRHGCKAYETAR